jgi:hypothetical protein
MKKLINFKLVSLAVFCLLLLAVEADAQRRTKKRAPQPKAAATSAANKNAAEIKAGATRVGEQIKILTQFVYVLGGIRKDIEAIDAAAKTNKATRAAVQQNEVTKKGVIASIANVRAGLQKLEADFKANPALQFYSISLLAVNDLAATAEQQANSNQFDQSGRTMIQAVAQLTDVLLSMQK